MVESPTKSWGQLSPTTRILAVTTCLVHHSVQTRPSVSELLTKDIKKKHRQLKLGATLPNSEGLLFHCDIVHLPAGVGGIYRLFRKSALNYV